MKNNLKRMLALGVIPVLMFLAGCTNPTGNDTPPPPTPRQEFLNFLNNTLPDVDHNVAVGSDYDGLREQLAIAMEDVEAFVNHNLGTLDIILGANAAHTTPGAGLDTLTLPGDNAIAANSGMNNYIGAISDRWPNHESLYAGMIPQNTR